MGNNSSKLAFANGLFMPTSTGSHTTTRVGSDLDDLDIFLAQCKKCREAMRRTLNQGDVLTAIGWEMVKSSRQDTENHTSAPKKRANKGVVWYGDENGERKVLPPTMSLWYNLYVNLS